MVVLVCNHCDSAVDSTLSSLDTSLCSNEIVFRPLRSIVEHLVSIHDADNLLRSTSGPTSLSFFSLRQTALVFEVVDNLLVLPRLGEIPQWKLLFLQ